MLVGSGQGWQVVQTCCSPLWWADVWCWPAIGAMRNVSPLTLVELSHASQSAQVCTANPHRVGTFTALPKLSVWQVSQRVQERSFVYESLMSYLILMLRHWNPPCSTPNAPQLLLYAVTLLISFLRWGDKWYWDSTSHWMNWWLSGLHVHTSGVAHSCFCSWVDICKCTFVW